MYVAQRIVDDIIQVITQAIAALKAGDTAELAPLSARTVHNSTIYQDKYSVEIAIVLYTLEKVLQQKDGLTSQFIYTLEFALKHLQEHNIAAYDQSIKEMLNHISKIDKRFTKNVTHIIEQAKIKKGSHVFEHGISLAQSAATLGVSQWELYNYIGKTKITDDGSQPVSQLKKRLAYAKAVFSHPHTTITFDAGPIITLALNGLLWMLPKLKEKMSATFLLPEAVKEELIDHPLHTKKHKLEAFRVHQQITNGTLTLIEKEKVLLKAKKIADICNTTFFAHGNPIQIVHAGEIEAVALMQMSGSHTLVVDERTMRYLIETPSRIKSRLERKLHTKVHVDERQYAKIEHLFKGIRTIRSAELLTVAFEAGLFDELYIDVDIPLNRQQCFEGLLWGLRLNGCGITDDEVKHLTRLISKKTYKRKES